MKRRILTVVVAFGCALGAWAATYKSGKLTYTYDVGFKEASLSKCDTSASGTVSVPASVKGCRVMQVSDRAFKNCKKVTAVKFASKDITLNTGAFENCTSLEKVSLPIDAYLQTGVSVFSGCKKLKSFTLPYCASFNGDCFSGSSIETLAFLNPRAGEGNEEQIFAEVADAKVSSLKKVVCPRGCIEDWKAAKEAAMGHGTEYATFLSGVSIAQASAPRAWIANSSSRGTVTLKIDGKKAANGATFKKGAKVSLSVKAKSGYVPREILEEEFGGAAMMTDAASLTVKKASGTDILFSTDYVTRTVEKAQLNALGDPLLDGDGEERGIVGEDIGKDGIHVKKVRMGRYFCAALANSAALATRTTFTATGLPSGLKFVRGGDGFWYIHGVPGSMVDFDTAPIYVTAKGLGGSKVVRRLNLKVEAPVFKECFTAEVGTDAYLTLGADFLGFTPSKPPQGFAFNSETFAASFTPTTPGYVQVTFKRPVTGVDGNAYADKNYVRYYVSPAASSYYPTIPKNLYATVGVKYSLGVADWFSGAKSPKVTGLPAGLKFDATKKKISGTPTKTGYFVLSVSKSVKGKTRTFKLPLSVSAGSTGGTVIRRYSASCEWLSGANRQVLLAGSSSSSVISIVPNKGVKVTASGLPKGVKLVKNKSGSYSLSGRATTPGTYVTTIKMSGNGGTVYERFEFKVFSHPLKGSYRGLVETPGVGIGQVSMTVDAAGKATLTVVEGSLKTKVSAYMRTDVWGMESSALEGEFTFKATLPAVTKPKLPKRTLTLTCKSEGSGLIGSAEGSIVPVSGSKGTALNLWCRYAPSAAQLALWSTTTHCSYGFAVDLKGSSGAYLGETVIGTVKYDAASAKATVKGRLPRGKEFSLTLPILYCKGYIEGYAPAVVTDADGTRYLLRDLPVNANAATYVQFLAIETQKGIVDVPWPEFVDQRAIALVPGAPQTVPDVFEGYTDGLKLRYALSEKPFSEFASLELAFDAKGKMSVVGGTKQSFSYSSSTCKATLTFTKGGYTYTVYLQAVEAALGPTDGRYMHGIIKRTKKGAKTVWGTAMVVGPAG